MNAAAFHINRDEKRRFRGRFGAQILNVGAELMQFLGSGEISREQDHAADIIFNEKIGFGRTKGGTLKPHEKKLANRRAHIFTIAT